MKVIWSPLAMERVYEIAEYMRRDSLQSAQRLVSEIFDRSARLERFPQSGRIVPEVGRPDIREVLHGSYRIIYRVSSKRVDILTVRHAKQILPIEDVETSTSLSP